MSTKAVIEPQDEPRTSADWQPAPEWAPSTIRAQEPRLARIVGGFALFLVLVGAVLWIAHATGRNVIINYLIAPGSIWPVVFVVLGLGGLLFHAASDPDMQVRRTYMAMGFAWLGIGAVVSLVPVKGAMGYLFLPYGLMGLTMGLLFLVAFVRQETEGQWRDPVVFVLGGVGVLLGVAGFGLSQVRVEFLLPNGLLIMLVGLVYWCVVVNVRGITDELGYRAALGMGALGLLGFLVALGRSMFQTSYLMPSGMLLMSFGLLYLVVSTALWSDNQLVVMTRRELAAFFYSPIAYIVLAGFTVIAWYLFTTFVLENLWMVNAPPGRSPAIPVIEPVIANYIVAWTPVICVIFVVPVLTMRLLSEERQAGTIEVMLTAPLDETQVVLSKFIAAFIFFMLIWVPFGLNLVSLRAVGGQPFDYLPVLGFSIALAFTGAGFVSMGLFFSSLTRNQVAAAILTFMAMLVLTFLFFFKRLVPGEEAWRTVLTHISYIDLWIKSLDGKLAPRDLLYHLSAAVFWLFLTVKVLESRKWR